MSKNCWEYTKCMLRKYCPAYPDHGRDCYYIKGTLCWSDTVDRVNIKKKVERCLECDFYNKIIREEI